MGIASQSSNKIAVKQLKYLQNKKTILFIAGFYYPSQIGGPCNSFYWLAKAIGKSDFDVTVMAMSTGIIDETIVFDNWYNTEYGRVIYIRTNYSNYSIKYIYACLMQIKKSQIIHLNSVFSLASFIIGLAAVLSNKPIIWAPRGEFAPSALLYKAIIKKWMLSIIKIFKHKILFHTTSEKESLDTRVLLDKDIKILQLPNYMDLPALQNVNKKDYFIYLGRIHPIKALDNIIEACYLSKFFKDSPYKLLIVGDNDNSYGETLKQAVFNKSLNEMILFMPHVSDIQEKNRLFAEARFSFLPSHSENFGNVVVESLGNGTPVVASKGTPWQVLQEENAGFWVSNEPSELAIVIDKIILMNEEELQRYSANAIVLAKNEFDINTNIYKWIAGYKQILKQNA